MKDVLVTVKTVQSDETGESDTIELTAEGKFAAKNGSYLIKYADVFMSGDNEPIHTTVKIGTDGAVSVTRSGIFKSRFVIECDKRFNCSTYYGRFVTHRCYSDRNCRKQKDLEDGQRTQ